MAGYLWIGHASTTSNEVVEVVLFEVKGNSDQVSVKRAEMARVAKPVAPKAKPVVADESAPALATENAVTTTSEESGSIESAGDSEVYGTANGIEVSAQERYRIELQAMLEKKKQYPLLAKRLRQQGKVLVKFTLRRDGSVAAAEIVSTSEFETLNKAARELISEISGLKPFPEEVKKQQWVFVLPVEYRM